MNFAFLCKEYEIEHASGKNEQADLNLVRFLIANVRFYFGRPNVYAGNLRSVRFYPIS